MKFLIPLSILVIGCAHRPSVDPLAHSWRVDPQGVSTGMPNYVLSPELYDDAAAAIAAPVRAPASDEDMAREMEAAEKRPSLRRLYFRALFQQWRDLAAHTGRDEALKSCPQYHHDKLMVEEEGPRRGSLVVQAVKPAQAHLAFYPEWSLPAGSATVWASKASDPRQALKRHESRLRRELRTMCEEGATDSYFRLENMVTYFAADDRLSRPDGFRAMLKIPVFSTMLLVGAVQEGGQGGLNGHDLRLLEKVKGLQLRNYIVELKKKRELARTGAL